MGCKDESQPCPTAPCPPIPDHEALKAEQEKIVSEVLTDSAAVIKIFIRDADALFKSNERSLMNKGDNNLNYFRIDSEVGKMPEYYMESEGKSIKDLISNVRVNKNAVWQIRMDDNVNNDGYYASFQEIDFSVGVDSTDINEPKPCNAFEKNMYPRGNSNTVTAKVKSGLNIVGCQQPYSIIFSITKENSGKRRSFVLDPWILVRR